VWTTQEKDGKQNQIKQKLFLNNPTDKNYFFKKKFWN